MFGAEQRMDEAVGGSPLILSIFPLKHERPATSGMPIPGRVRYGAGEGGEERVVPFRW